MKNPNTPVNKFKAFLKKRWSAEDYPDATPRFQFELFAKDIGKFMFLPILSAVIVKSCDSSGNSSGTKKRTQLGADILNFEHSTSQIINFQSRGGNSPFANIPRKAPGSLVKVRLMNIVETFGNVPVYAQIVNSGLGSMFFGGTLIGEATPDSGFERINIVFKHAKPANKNDVAYSISGRALSLDGTFGLDARKKEGYFARAAIISADSAAQNLRSGSNERSLRDFLLQALTSGFGSEFSQSAQVEKTRAQVLTLPASIEFFVELTDYFPEQIDDF